MASSALIDDLLKQFAENPRRVFARLANEYRKRGELDTAIEICRAHVPLQPTYISGYIVLGQALYETGQLDEARSTFETALGLDPENLIGLRQLGDIARAKGDADGARGWYRRLLEVDPQNEEVEGLLREMDAPAAPAASTAPAAPTAANAISWNDINPEHIGAAPPAAEPSAPREAPAKPALDFDYDVLASFGEAESPPPIDGLVTQEAAHAEPPAAQAAHTEAPPPIEPPAAPAVPAPASAQAESSHDEPLPAAFITETMAELYLQQGHREQALDIYRLLLAQRPGDVSLLNRIARLEQPAPAAPLERTVRAFFGRFANRRPPGVRTETDLTPVSAPAVPEPVAEEPVPLGVPVASATPATEATEAETETTAAETEAAAPPAPEAAESAAHEAHGWAADESAAPAAEVPTEPAHEPEPTPEPAHDEPVVEATAVSETIVLAAAEPSIADFAPSEPEAAASEAVAESIEPAPQAQPEPEPMAAPVEAEQAPAPAFVSDRVRSFAELFAGRAPSPADEQAATTLATAYGAEAGMPNGMGQATRAASDALSLDDVFGGGAHEHESGPVSFDEFFSPRDAGAPVDAAADGSPEPRSAPPVAARRADDADLELFHQWLEGLKK